MSRALFNIANPTPYFGIRDHLLTKKCFSHLQAKQRGGVTDDDEIGLTVKKLRSTANKMTKSNFDRLYQQIITYMGHFRNDSSAIDTFINTIKNLLIESAEMFASIYVRLIVDLTKDFKGDMSDIITWTEKWLQNHSVPITSCSGDEEYKIVMSARREYANVLLLAGFIFPEDWILNFITDALSGSPSNDIVKVLTFSFPNYTDFIKNKCSENGWINLELEVLFGIV